MVKTLEGRLLTTPEEISNPSEGDCLSTGNDFISLPSIRSLDGSVERFGVLHMGTAALLEACGSSPAKKTIGTQPLLSPKVSIDGVVQDLSGKLSWDWLEYFLPSFSWTSPETGFEIKATIFAPSGDKGFVYLLRAYNSSSDKTRRIDLGLSGCWGDSLQTVFSSGRVFGVHRVYRDRWTAGPVFELRAGPALMGWAIMASAQLDQCHFKPADGSASSPQGRINRDTGGDPEGDPKGDNGEEFSVPVGHSIQLNMSKTIDLQPGESTELAFYVGVNREGDGARTVAIDLARQGADKLLEKSLLWLKERSLKLEGLSSQPRQPRQRLEAVLNRNLFFNRFYALGRCIDNEELSAVTSRSPRYYVSTAFWARDSLLWSLPAVLLLDPATAREMLVNCFQRHGRNAGIHSLYINGSVLYPGFELDELCAFVIGLNSYIEHTGDSTILAENAVSAGVLAIEGCLDSKKHSEICLYESFLCPSDDPVKYPYLTYDNTLVALTFDILAGWLEQGWIKRDLEIDTYHAKAKCVRKDIFEHLASDGPLGRMFVWSSDLQAPAKFEFYDEPPGSLKLLPYYGLCPADNPIYQNTVAWIQSEHNPFCYKDVKFPGLGCPHSEHPFVMDLFNDLLSGRQQQAKAVLLEAPLDDGLACEAFDRENGRVKTGEAFATCAGFLAYAIYRAFGKSK